MGDNDKYGKYGNKAWKIKMINTATVLVVLFIVAGIAGGGYVFIKPRYETYQEAKALEKKEEEKRIAKEEEAKAKEEAAKKKRQAKKEEEKKAEKKAEETSSAPTNTPIPEADMNYVIPDSNSRYLSNEDVKNLSIQQVNYAKNEIYARHGRKFTSKELSDYFNSKAWYNGTIDPATFDANYKNYFNEYEIANTEFLSKTEKNMNPNGYQLDQ